MSIVGVVLAGGKSSRMQVNKSELRWQGKTLLESTSKLLSDAGCSRVLISKNQSGYIRDRFSGSGPLAGIEACLGHIRENNIKATAMLVMPVDMPLMDVSLLKTLIQKVKKNLVVHFNLSHFPLLLPVNDQLSELLTTSLIQYQQGSGVSIHRLLGHFDSQVLTIDKEQKSAFINCNTPQEWQELIHHSNNQKQ